MWDRIEHLPRGQKIKIHLAKGRWERCDFGGATDACLFCAPQEDSDRAQTWQGNRAAIYDYKLDHDVRKGRLVFAAFLLTGGISIGLEALHNTRDEGAGVFGGLLGAGLGAAVGVGGSCIAGHRVNLIPPPSYPPAYGFSYNVPLRRLPGRPR